MSNKLLEMVRALVKQLSNLESNPERCEELFKRWIAYSTALREQGNASLGRKRINYQVQTGDFDKATQYWKLSSNESTVMPQGLTRCIQEFHQFSDKDNCNIPGLLIQCKEKLGDKECLGNHEQGDSET